MDKRIQFFLSPVTILALFTLAGMLSPAGAQPYPGTAVVNKEVKIEIDIWGHFADSLVVRGTAALQWSDTTSAGGDYTIETEIVDLDLTGTSPIGPVKITNNGNSTGQVTNQTPGDLFPADSFFDLFFFIEFPSGLPGITLHNEDPFPISALINDLPPYFDPYEGTVSPSLILYDQHGTPVGEITLWWEEAFPYHPPEAFVHVVSTYNTPVAIPYGDTILVRASLSGDPVPESATFGYRPAGSSDPFTTFWIDDNGDAPYASTYYPIYSGDGWTGYLDISGFALPGEYYEFEVCFDVTGHPAYCDTTVALIDPTPATPSFDSQAPESIAFFDIDSTEMFKEGFESPDESAWGADLKVNELDKKFERDLTPLDMEKLSRTGTLLNKVSCGPVSAASCLKYWADNGHPKLKHPGGDTTKPEKSAKDMAKELRGLMKTKAREGTSIGNMEAGIKKYLKSHGLTGWKIKYCQFKDDEGFTANMLREFVTDREDVILYLVDITGSGETADTLGHFVTASSFKYYSYKRWWINHWEEVVSMRIDFMDPKGGKKREFDVMPQCPDGEPLIRGYKLAPRSPNDARIAGFLSVSPPEEDSDERAMRPAGDWITVDTGTTSGSGQPDTLWWDITGFAGGIYLTQITVYDGWGNECTDLRLAAIPEGIVGIEDPEIPPLTTGLKRSYPNPFNPATTILFSLARPMMATVTVYDIAGRRVRRLIEGSFMEAGEHRVIWDGRNDGGRATASGIYFCRLTTRERESAIKIVLMR